MASVKVLKTKKEFDEFYKGSNTLLRLVHFSSQWCSACPEMDNLLTDFQKEFPNTFEFVKIDAEEVAEVSLENSVTSVPTIMFFKKSKAIDKRDGFQPTDIKNLIIKYSSAVEPFTLRSTEGEENVEKNNMTLNERIKELINKKRLTVFMKGNSDHPKCGFSRQIVDILKAKNIDFWTFDILNDEEVRQGLKKYSDWPTYPQLYLDGELIGGLDIIREEMSDPNFVAKLPKLT